jgi:hypothetical protein
MMMLMIATVRTYRGVEGMLHVSINRHYIEVISFTLRPLISGKRYCGTHRIGGPRIGLDAENSFL